MNKKYFIWVIFLCILYMSGLTYLLYRCYQDSPYLKTEFIILFYSSLIFVGLILGCSVLMYYKMRRSLTHFVDETIAMIDQMMNQEHVVFNLNQETLLSKLSTKFKQLVDVFQYREQQYLNEKNKMKELIGDISHQIKTPLANLTMYNETLLQRQLTADQQVMCYTVMQSQIQKLDHLIQALIKMSRLENGVIQLHKSKQSLKQLLTAAHQFVALKAEAKKMTIEFAMDADIWVDCDVLWTGEALVNLIENGIKYSHEGGRVLLTGSETEMFTSISIIDNGIGIKPDEINEIFKRFYRSHDVHQIEGVGIGLYLVREIISKQGGFVKVRSTPNQGSKFTLYFPKEKA